MIQQTIEFSSNLFSGFSFNMNRETIKSFNNLNDLIEYAKSELLSVLVRYNFTMLIEEFNKCDFHIHTHSFEDLFKNHNIIYICDHVD